MGIKTTVAVNQSLRKKIKKLALILDTTQSNIIQKAITLLESEILSHNSKEWDATLKISQSKKKIINIPKILENATTKVCSSDPVRKRNQKALLNGPQTIDNFIFSQWDSGLEE
ncbi:MAG: hypothetical protein ACTSVU_07105 [Promethearchaeota archaeon]